MQTRVFTAISAAVAILAPVSAQAGGFSGQAKLVSAGTAPASATINGIDWTCDGDTCLGVGQRDQSIDGFMRECRKVATAVGPLAAYASNGRVMRGGDLVACNRLAEGDRAKLVAAK